MDFHAYLFFSDGRCQEAFTRYQEILGGELEAMPFSAAPSGEEAPISPDDQDLIMHAALTVGNGLLMGSDDPTGDGGPMKGIAVSLTCDDAESAERVFAALAEGGEVSMPMGEAFWARRFGMCTDRFGVPWMVSAEGVDLDGGQ